MACPQQQRKNSLKESIRKVPRKKKHFFNRQVESTDLNRQCIHSCYLPLSLAYKFLKTAINNGRDNKASHSLSEIARLIVSVNFDSFKHCLYPSSIIDRKSHLTRESRNEVASFAQIKWNL